MRAAARVVRFVPCVDGSLLARVFLRMMHGWSVLPCVRQGSAGFNADKARSLLLKERQDLAAPQLPAHHSSARRINPMDLKDVLREIKADRGNFVRGRLPFGLVMTPRI